MSTIRTRALDAAIELLAVGGLRSLTHLRVDDRAGLPKGSTSNYFRTRAALLRGVAEAILAREVPAVSAAFSPASADELVDALSALLEVMTDADRTVTAARLVLFLEASHDADLREVLSRGRATMEAAVTGALTRLGAPDPSVGAQAIAACCEGLILHRIARHDDRDPRGPLALVVKGALR